MSSYHSPSQLESKNDYDIKKSYTNFFPELTMPSSQNPLEEVGLHKQLSKTLDDLKSNTYSEIIQTSKNNKSPDEKMALDHVVTPKSQKQKPSDVKRWASVVKAQRKLQLPTELECNEKLKCEDNEITSEVGCFLKTFPKSFESHKSFFIISDKMFYCNICSLNLDSVLSLTNHLKTRKHQDNAIELFKTKIPMHLHHLMEFVSFYGCTLCCNLCRCSIPMSSYNPYETIVNIFAHNSLESHISRKMNRTICNSADTILQVLSQSSSVIMENLNVFKRKMIPEFKCQLCNVVIPYDDNEKVLSQNFTNHIESLGHKRTKKAVEVLKLYREASVAGNDNWAIVNGNIMCTYCNLEFETNLQNLITHISEVEHSNNVALKKTSNCNKDSENNIVNENLKNEAKLFTLNKPKKRESESTQNFESNNTSQVNPGSRLKELLNTMPADLKYVNYVIENEKGSITCLICNRVVPPSTYNLRTHLQGNKHSVNLELKTQVQVVGNSSKTVAITSSQTFDSKINMKDTSSKLQTSLIKTVSKQLDYIFKVDNVSSMCMICQETLPNNTVHEHLTSDKHKEKESLWLKNCPGCSSTNPFTCKVLKVLPTSLKMYKCRKMETIPASVLNCLYSLLMKENHLISKNEHFLLKNVDGKHTYCELCKTLIPLSLDLDVLENNLISHLKEKRHVGLCLKKTDIAQDASISPKVARTLFDLTDEFQKIKVDCNVFEDFKVGVIENMKTIKDKNSTLSFDINNVSSTVKTIKDEVFIFGKEENSNSSCKEDPNNLKESRNTGINSALPVTDVTSLVKFGVETSEEVLTRRQKQIDYGKNTEGYARYCKLVPRRKRGLHHPITPPKHLQCSRRTWDGMIRAWRRQLHSWDAQSSSVDSDIRPLN